MNSTARIITLPISQAQAAIEEYLHRLKLIDGDEQISAIADTFDSTFMLSVTKEATVH